MNLKVNKISSKLHKPEQMYKLNQWFCSHRRLYFKHLFCFVSRNLIHKRKLLVHEFIILVFLFFICFFFHFLYHMGYNQVKCSQYVSSTLQYTFNVIFAVYYYSILSHSFSSAFHSHPSKGFFGVSLKEI